MIECVNSLNMGDVEKNIYLYLVNMSIRRRNEEAASSARLRIVSSSRI